MRDKAKQFDKQRADERKKIGMGPRGLDAISSLSSQFRGGNPQDDGVRAISSSTYNAQHGNDNSGNVRIHRHDDNRSSRFGRNNDSDSDENKRDKPRSKRPGTGMTLGMAL